MSDKYLKKIQGSLKNYFSYFKHDDILAISEDKSVLPFAFIIADNNYPDNLLISLAVDYPCSEKAVEVALISNSIRKVTVAEQFFISKDGNTYLGDDAFKYYQIETDIPLEDITPESSFKH